MEPFVSVGPVLSLIVKVRETDVPVLPQASAAVQCALITRVAPQPATLLSSTYTGVAAPLQASLALAPLFQLLSAARLPAPSHSTVLSAGAVTTGGVSSSTVMVWLHEEELPHSSVAVQVRLVAYLILPPVAQLPAMAVSL